MTKGNFARRWLLPTLLAGSVAGTVTGCADRSVGSGDTGGETQGPEPGELYGGCVDADECFDEWCVHPAGEPGFCTYPCSESCMADLGGTATTTCLPVEDQDVCALDCSDGKSCPAGMRCEQIDADGQPRSICF